MCKVVYTDNVHTMLLHVLYYRRMQQVEIAPKTYEPQMMLYTGMPPHFIHTYSVYLAC